MLILSFLQKQTAEALSELKEYLRQRPTDEDATDLLDAWQETKPAGKTAGQSSQTTQPDPLERIDRIFNAAAFRQVALTMDEMQAARRAQLSPRERALSLAAEARSYLDRGLLLEAERLYHSALESDGSLPAAHIGLGEIRERNGDLDSARAEAHTALQFESSAAGWLLLARIDLLRNRLNEATEEVGEALKLEPANRVAIELRSTIAQKQGKN